MSNVLKIVKSELLLSEGMDVTIYDDSFLLKSIERRMPFINCDSVNTYCEYLKQDRNEAGLFLQSLNVNYSEFFRDTLSFAYLDQVILPSLLEQKLAANETEIRIWSAACASGQEAYSMAMLCDEAIKRSKRKMGYRIFASDIDEKTIANGRKGHYQASNLNMVTLKRIQTYFTENNNSYTVISQLKDHLDFSTFDLLSDQKGCPATSIYGNFDIVFCSNLLFYYQPEYRNRILGKVGECLSPNGYVITGETEREILKSNNYQEVFTNSSIFQKT
jgi:chemotaxis methyl-accepting protein methylase